MFRCPNCGKVHKIKLKDGHSLLATKNMDKIWYVKEPFYEGNLAKALTNMLFEMRVDNEYPGYTKDGSKEIVADNDIVECSYCNHKAVFSDFVEAAVNPVDYFDKEQMCSCGGELWIDRIPYSNRYGLQCEDCGWIKPKSVVSGNDDPTLT